MTSPSIVFGVYELILINAGIQADISLWTFHYLLWSPPPQKRTVPMGWVFPAILYGSICTSTFAQLFKDLMVYNRPKTMRYSCRKHTKLKGRIFGFKSQDFRYTLYQVKTFLSIQSNPPPLLKKTLFVRHFASKSNGHWNKIRYAQVQWTSHQHSKQGYFVCNLYGTYLTHFKLSYYCHIIW